MKRRCWLFLLIVLFVVGDGSLFEKFEKKIFDQQNLKTEECRITRLLIIDMASTSFEGTGSLLKQVMIGLSTAMHSNRTLIWGLQLPATLADTRELWNNEELHVGCADNRSGAFGCFLLPLSTCLLDDVTPAEIIDYSRNAYNDSSRIRVADVARNGITLYHPPKAWLSKSELGSLPNVRHAWAAAIASYVFRMQPQLVSAIAERFQKLHGSSMYQKGMWGVHVRHGDLKAMPDIYGHKKAYDFEEYFESARQLSHSLQTSPSVLYVSTDSISAEEVQERYFRQFEGDSEGGSVSLVTAPVQTRNRNIYRLPVKSSSKPKRWFGDVTPSIKIVNNTEHYRTAHGSHTVAANGGCVKDQHYSEKGLKCALNYEVILSYQSTESHRAVSKAQRLMRVITEAMVDLYILSQSDVLVAQGSSHFSTVAALLIWGRQQAERVDNVVFLDKAEVEAGLFPTAFLHGINILNTTSKLDSNIPNLIHVPERQAEISVSPDERSGIRMKDGIPHISATVLYAETDQWLPQDQATVPSSKKKLSYTRQPWLSHCPHREHQSVLASQYALQTVTSAITHAQCVVNLGVTHLDQLHRAQAMTCWSDGLRDMDKLHEARATVPGLEQLLSAENKQSIDDIIDVATGNMKTMSNLAYVEMMINMDTSQDDRKRIAGSSTRQQLLLESSPTTSTTCAPPQSPNIDVHIANFENIIHSVESQLIQLKQALAEMKQEMKNSITQ